MNDEDKKLLTEFLGECWHKPSSTDCSCGERHPPLMGNPNRTFTFWQDLGDLKNQLVKKEEWADFYWWVRSVIAIEDIFSHFTSWLLNPKRFCQLVADYLKEKP